MITFAPNLSKMSSTKETIKSKSARLFRKKGYKATTMRDIADDVGIKAASIYNHYKGKQEILTELLLEPAHLFTDGMAKVNNSDVDAGKKLEDLIALHVELAVKHTDKVALITSEWVHLEEHSRTEYLALRDRYENEFKTIIETGKRKGILKDLDTEIILFSTLSTLRWLYSWYGKNKKYDAKELKRQITECLMSGIKI